MNIKKGLEALILSGAALVGCVEESISSSQIFPLPKTYRLPARAEEKYIPSSPVDKQFYNAFGFGPYAINHKAKKGNQTVLVLKKSSGNLYYKPGDITAAIPGIGSFRGSVWVTYAGGTLYMGRSGSERSFRDYTYYPEKNLIKYQCWDPEKVDAPLQLNALPAGGVSFCFDSNWDALLEFHKFFLNTFGESPFPEHRVFEAVVNVNPTKAINEVYADIERVKSEIPVFKFSEFQKAVDKYQVLSARVKTAKTDELKKALIPILQNFKNERGENPAIWKIENILYPKPAVKLEEMFAPGGTR